MIKAMKLPELHNGIVLERFGRYNTAQLAYLKGLRNQKLIESADALRTLEERWKECAYNLRLYQLLFTYGKLNNDHIVLSHCFTRVNKWE